MLINYMRKLKECLIFDVYTKHTEFRVMAIKFAILGVFIGLGMLWSGFSYFALLLGILFCSTQMNGRCLYYLVFLLPLMSIFRAQPSDTYFISYLIVPIVITMGIKFLINLIKKKEKINWLFFVTIGALVTYLIARADLSNLTILISLLVGVVITVIAYCYRKDLDFKELVLSFGMGILFSIIIGFIFYGRARLPLFAYPSSVYGYERFQGVAGNVNVFACEMMLFFSCLVVLHIKGNVKFITFPIYAIVFIALVNTYSKSAIIMYVIIMIFFVIALVIKELKCKKYMRLLLSFLAIILISTTTCFAFRLQTEICLTRFSSNIRIVTIDKNAGNFSENESGAIDSSAVSSSSSMTSKPLDSETKLEINYSAITTGRFDIWKTYINKLISSPKSLIFGFGVGSTIQGSWSEYAGTSTHNTFIQALYYVGIFGVLLMLFVFITTIDWKGLRTRGFSGCGLVVLMSLAAFLMGLDFFSFRLSIYLILGIYATINIEEDTTSEQIVGEIKIPKKIHYIWVGGREIPKHIKKCIASWSDVCPDYEIKRWDESNLNIDIKKYCREAYDAKKYAFASDVLRFDVLYREGGIYLDVDVLLNKPLDPLLKYEMFVGFEGEKCINPGLIMGAVAGEKHLKDLLDSYDNFQFVKENGEFNKMTICDVTTNYLKDKGLKISNKMQNIDGVQVFPSEYFCPYNPNTSKFNKTNNTFATHLYLASWYTKKQKLKNTIKKILNFFTNGYFGLALIKVKGLKTGRKH